MISTTTISDAIDVAINRINTGKSTYSCNALSVALMDVSVSDCQYLIRQYVEHSSARGGGSGFKDISTTVWGDLTPSERATIRIQRLSAFRKSLIDNNSPTAIEFGEQMCY